uniref:ADF-H domain-containing protein n=1 Tax=Noctiluca scintillans TaxID=2966 RepID=A0A7S1F0U3_NOCSC|mmetsp:Transcript_22912/g.60313  ORF Transcript_22912/g.60313 Transcript_22912/m.60313 type:complete len:136 (+) Transcript_22912:98-505(+)
MSGVTVHEDCMTKYNEIKMGKALRFALFKIENKKQIVFDSDGPKDLSFEDFAKSLPTGEPRYALCDIDYTSEDGRPQTKLTFVFWSPDDCGVKERMLYASSKDAIKKKFTGIMKELQANDMGDLKWDDVESKMRL